MGSTYLKVLFLVAILCGACGGTSSSEFDSLKVPVSEFVGSVRSTIDIIRQVMSIVSQFSGAFGDFRLGNAVSDCLDLMDLSVDQLSWTLSASQNPNGILQSLLVNLPFSKVQLCCMPLILVSSFALISDSEMDLHSVYCTQKYLFN